LIVSQFSKLIMWYFTLNIFAKPTNLFFYYWESRFLHRFQCCCCCCPCLSLVFVTFSSKLWKRKTCAQLWENTKNKDRQLVQVQDNLLLPKIYLLSIKNRNCFTVLFHSDLTFLSSPLFAFPLSSLTSLVLVLHFLCFLHFWARHSPI
jgi:hypothetical protein